MEADNQPNEAIAADRDVEEEDSTDDSAISEVESPDVSKQSCNGCEDEL